MTDSNSGNLYSSKYTEVQDLTNLNKKQLEANWLIFIQKTNFTKVWKSSLYILDLRQNFVVILVFNLLWLFRDYL